MFIDTLTNINFYEKIDKDIYAGLLFIKEADIDIPLGEYPISDRAKAVVMEYNTQVKNDFGYEAHQHVIDVQCCIKGRERIPWIDVASLTPHTKYNEEKDLTFFNWTEPQGEAIIGNGVFAVFYPHDAHAPVHCITEPGYIKKIVIKVKFENCI